MSRSRIFGGVGMSVTSALLLMAAGGAAVAGGQGMTQMAQAGETPCGRPDCPGVNAGDGQGSGMRSWENRGAERPRGRMQRAGDCGGPMSRGDGSMMGAQGGMMGGRGQMPHRGSRFGMHMGAGGPGDMPPRDGSCASSYGDADSSNRFVGK